MSPETRQKISETLKRKGIKPPSRLGSKASEETRKKMSESSTWKGKKRPDISLWMKLNNPMGMLGKKSSIETKKLLSENLKEQWHSGARKGGWKQTPEWSKKQSERMLGHKSYLPEGYTAWNKGMKGVYSSPLKGTIREDFRGENHPRWIADRSKLAKRQERNDSAYGDWRKQVWLRDNFKCKIANPDCKGRIEAHHILGWKSHPELRYQPNNGITLCRFHHPRKRDDEMRLSPYFQELVMTEAK